MRNDDIDVWLGLDVGKQSHHACALDRHGKRIVDKPIGQDEAQIREPLAHLGEHGNVLPVVDQPSTIGPCRRPWPTTWAWPWATRRARRYARQPSCCPATRGRTHATHT